MQLRDPSTLSVDEILAAAPTDPQDYVPPVGYVGLLWCGGICFAYTGHERIPVPEDGVPGIWLECTQCGREVGPVIQEADPRTGLPFPRGQRRIIPAFPPAVLREAGERARAAALRVAIQSGAVLNSLGQPAVPENRGGYGGG